MIKQISKMIFWSAVAILFCFIVGNHSRAEAFDDYDDHHDHIVINEIYSSPDTKCDQIVNPDCNKEWVEIYNPTSGIVSLDGYFLMDGNKSKKSLSGVLVPGGYFVYFNSSGWLNNSGDILFLLFESEDSIIDQITYGSWNDKVLDNNLSYNLLNVFKPASNSEQSISRIPNGYDSDIDKDDFRLTSLTQNQANVAVVVEEEPVIEDNVDIQIISIADARQKEAGTAVIITGTVTIPPNQLSAQYFYIQDNSAGIQIYCYKKDFPALTAGDIVQVEGEISDYYSDKRVKINLASNIIITGHQDVPVVKEVIIDEISDNFVGQIVTIEGTVSETSGSTFYVEGSGEIKVNIREETNIDKPRMSRGDMVKITGVVSRYKDTYQILPFEQSGVTILTSGKLPGAGKSRDGPRLELLICLALWNIQPKAKLKLKKLLKKLPKTLNQVMFWR